MADDPRRFRSDRGKGEYNPFVERIDEFAPWAMRSDAADAVSDWRTELGIGPDAPLLVEVGPGNGFFFREVGRRFPDAGLVAIEVRFKRVWLTAKKAREYGLEAFRVLHHSGGHLADLFAANSVDGVYVNHPDPWPKERHHKHRLLQPPFAADVAAVLKPGGEVWVQSDFQPYGPLAQEVFAAPTFAPIAYTTDLHGATDWLENPPESACWAGDIQTNYERKKRAAGEPIVLAGFRRA